MDSFITAGAAGVVATRWNLDDSTARDWMTVFYARLLLGQTPASALHQAALSILRQGATAHPYYWAGYQLFGG